MPTVITSTSTTTDYTGLIWRAWTETFETTYTATNTIGNATWVRWTTDDATTSTTSSNVIWRVWTANDYTYGSTLTYPAAVEPTVQPARVSDVAKAAAEAKARDLLLEHLTPEQAREFEASKSFVVTSRSGRRYRITLGRAHNVHELDADGKPALELCGHVADYAVPNGDNVLAQKLMLEASEEEYLKLANVWDLRSGRQMISRSGEPLRRVS